MLQSILFLYLIVMVKGENLYKNYAKYTDCGKTPSILLRIVGGEESMKSEFPWMVSLTRRGGHLCGGAIISEKYVVTAAHCICSGVDDDFHLPQSFQVKVAQHDITDKNSDAYSVDVKSIKIHPGYKCTVPKDDIALLELSHSIEWSKSVAPVCVSTVKNLELGQEGAEVTVAGWGWTNEDHSIGRRSDRLLKAKLKVIKNEDCKQWYKEQKKQITVLESHICAGYKKGGIDACWADSGGPLMRRDGGVTSLVGVVSTGRGCARVKSPGIYTRISDYVEWIDENLNNVP